MSSTQPINLSPVDCSTQALHEAADYGVQVVNGYAGWLSNTPARIDGARVLEIGPGLNYAGAIGLWGMGATTPVTVSDRWLSRWRREYHPEVYRLIASKLRDKDQQSAAAFDLIAWQGYTRRVRELECGVENMRCGDESFDLVFSNAVLEHLEDHEKAARELYRITAKGGWHFHQIDYRDHRDFTKPLEHLLVSPEEWDRHSRSECEPFSHGTQLRWEDHARMFKEAGFEIYKTFPDDHATPEYLADFQARSGRRDDLSIIGVLFILHKRS
jgi:SAM-dependent methyltransferase